MGKLVLIKNGLYVDVDDIVLLTDIKNVDERTIASASKMCCLDKDGKEEAARCLLTLRGRDRDVLVSVRLETILKRIKGKEEDVE